MSSLLTSSPLLFRTRSSAAAAGMAAISAEPLRSSRKENDTVQQPSPPQQPTGVIIENKHPGVNVDVGGGDDSDENDSSDAEMMNDEEEDDVQDVAPRMRSLTQALDTLRKGNSPPQQRPLN